MATQEQRAKREIRASFLSIASKCPGAMHGGDAGGITIREDAGDVTQGGNAVHKVCERIVHTSIRPEDLTPYIERYGCDPDFLGRATWYALEYWREYRGAFPDPVTEQEMKAPFGPFLLTGHTDLVSVIANVEARLLDWKAGYRTEVDAEPQMRAYAYLAGHNFAVPKVSATVVWLADQTYQNWTWTFAELMEWANQTTRRIGQWDGQFTIGDHCRYCPRFFACPAQKAIIQSTVQSLVVIGDHDAEIELVALGELYPAVQSVERLCKAFRDLARRTVEAAGPVPMADGMELTLIPSRRETIEPLIAWPVISEKLDEGALAGCVSISKTKLLKAIADNAPRGQKGTVKDALMDGLRAVGAIATKEITSLHVVRSKTEDESTEQEK